MKTSNKFGVLGNSYYWIVNTVNTQITFVMLFITLMVIGTFFTQRTIYIFASNQGCFYWQLNVCLLQFPIKQLTIILTKCVLHGDVMILVSITKCILKQEWEYTMGSSARRQHDHIPRHEWVCKTRWLYEPHIKGQKI